jgi:hypothetical protein
VFLSKDSARTYMIEKLKKARINFKIATNLT